MSREALPRELLSREPLRQLLHQLASFCLVGGVGLVVDIGVFTLLRVSVFSPEAVHGGPILAKVVSTAVAIAVNWVGNRFWTFRAQRGPNVLREAFQFTVASLVGLVIAIGCLWLSHYVLGLSSVLDDNISANVIGLGLGTAARFVLYRWWVFGARTRAA